jgi:hypothetical protein
MSMDVAAKLLEAQVLRVAIVDDDLSEQITLEDLEIADRQAAALLNDETDPDREAYVELLVREGRNPAALNDLAEPLSEEAIRAAAPARLRDAAEAARAARKDRAEPVRRVIELLQRLGIAAAAIDTYPTPQIPNNQLYDLIIVDYFLVDTAADATLPFIQEVLQAHEGQEQPLQVILMSSHDEQLKADFKTIRPTLQVSSSRLRIMEKPKTDVHLISWKAALYQLASDRSSVGTLERFIRDAGTTLTQVAKDTATKLWELDLQAMDLLHELTSKDNDDYVRYVEDAVSRRLLSGLEEDGGMRASLQHLDAAFTPHRGTNLLSPTAEIGDSRAAIHGLMHSMEWRSGKPVLPAFPTAAEELERSRWIRKHIRFGMVLRDPVGSEWLNITQACDLAQADDEDIGQSTVVFLGGQRSLPAEKADGNYYHPMSAMMAQAENHVLTWSLRNVRTESIQSFSTTFGRGWQVIGELRQDVAQSIAATFGARAARVGLPITLNAWRLSGCAIRVGDINGAEDVASFAGTPLSGYAIRRVSGEKHELHLDRPSLDGLLTAHGGAFDDSVLPLLTGTQLKKGGKSSFDGRPVILYCKTRPANVGDVRAQLSNSSWLAGAGNVDRILVVLWCAP